MRHGEEPFERRGNLVLCSLMDSHAPEEGARNDILQCLFKLIKRGLV
jgi:hypothetical protein